MIFMVYFITKSFGSVIFFFFFFGIWKAYLSILGGFLYLSSPMSPFYFMALIVKNLFNGSLIFCYRTKNSKLRRDIHSRKDKTYRCHDLHDTGSQIALRFCVQPSVAPPFAVCCLTSGKGNEERCLS